MKTVTSSRYLSLLFNKGKIESIWHIQKKVLRSEPHFFALEK